jgi:uncharacterized protein (TIGR00725 family)
MQAVSPVVTGERRCEDERMQKQQLIGVIGGGSCDARVAEVAEAVGRLIAEGGRALVCGGLGGVMEAACRGAADAGGLTIGILPGTSRDDANPYISLALPTGMGPMRNVIIVRSAAALVAVDGGPGTLSEIAHALQLGVPVVSLGSWDVSPEVEQVDSPEAAVARALELAGPADAA